jgi:hypothetical protein
MLFKLKPNGKPFVLQAVKSVSCLKRDFNIYTDRAVQRIYAVHLNLLTFVNNILTSDYKAQRNLYFLFC